MLDQLTAAIERHSVGEGLLTAVPRLRLVTIDEAIAPVDMLYEPMICFIGAGVKRTTSGAHVWRTGPGEMFVSAMDVPISATFEQLPYRSAVLHLDPAVLAGLLLEIDDAGPGPAAEPAGQFIAAMPAGVAEAVTRLVRLLDTPGDIRALAGRTEAEILYRLLGTPLGPALRQLAVADSALARVGAAAGWIRRNYHRPLRIEAIAAVANMSVATLHRQFKAATGMSPIRFQKSLRLQEARRLLLAGDTTATHVAEVVGYASPTQFNREYRRTYGLPPAQDATRLRQRLTTA
jgi:AraC-like DNA-binding protein